MEVFQQLRQLYVTVNNDLRSLQQITNRPDQVQGMLPKNSAEKIVKDLSLEIRAQKDEVGAKIKEIRDDTYFCEVIASGFDLINYNMQQLEEVEFHLQKYSVQPITNNHPKVLSAQPEPQEASKVFATPKVIDNNKLIPQPFNVAPVANVYDLTRTPNPADFGITERTFQHLDEVKAYLKKLQTSTCKEDCTKEGKLLSGQPLCDSAFVVHPTDIGLSLDFRLGPNSVPCPSVDPNSYLNPKPKPVFGAELTKEDSAFAASDVTTLMGLNFGKEEGTSKGLISDKTALTKSCNSKTLEKPESSTCSVWSALNVELPPTLLANTKHILGSKAMEKLWLKGGSHLSESDISRETPAADMTSFLSERTLNMLRQYQLAKGPESEIKAERYSGREAIENVPPMPSAAAHDLVAKRRIDLENQSVETPFLSSSGKSTAFTSEISKTDFGFKVPGTTAFASVDGSDDATRALRCLSLNSRAVVASSVSSDSSCAQLQPLSAMEYENCLPESIQRIISLDLINKMIAKCNGILQKKFIAENGSGTISIDDLKGIVRGKNAELFLKLMVATKRLSAKSGLNETNVYDII